MVLPLLLRKKHGPTASAPEAAGPAELNEAASQPQGGSIGAPACAPTRDLPVSSASNAGPLVPPSTRRPRSAAGCQRLPRPCPSSSSKRPRVGPAPAPPQPGGRCALSAALTGTGTRSAALPRPPPSLSTALTFGCRRGRQAPPRAGRLGGLRALPQAVLHQLEVRRVERVEPGERRDGREHGDLRRATRAQRGGEGRARHRRGGRGERRARGRAVRPYPPSPPPQPHSPPKMAAARGPLLGRRQGAEADRGPGAVTLSFADAAGRSQGPRSRQAIGGGAPRTGTALRRPLPPPPRQEGRRRGLRARRPSAHHGAALAAVPVLAPG